MLSNWNWNVSGAEDGAKGLAISLGQRALLSLLHACAGTDLRQSPDLFKGLLGADYRMALSRVERHRFSLNSKDLENIANQVSRIGSTSRSKFARRVSRHHAYNFQ